MWSHLFIIDHLLQLSVEEHTAGTPLIPGPGASCCCCCSLPGHRQTFAEVSATPSYEEAPSRRVPSPAPCASLFPSSPSPFLCESQPPATSLQKSESWLGSREMGPAACETTDMRYEEWEMREQTHTHSLVLTLMHTHPHKITHIHARD